MPIVHYGLKDVSVVIPIHNDRTQLACLLDSLSRYPELEVVVVDATSTDNPSSVACSAKYVVGPTNGRGFQLDYGIRQTQRAWIWMLHADSEIRESNITQLEAALSQCQWGRFDVRLLGDRLMFRVIAWFMNERSSFSKICTGDQGIFVRRDLLDRVGGIPNQLLMEDIELSKQLRTLAKPLRLRVSLGSSARKWEIDGIWSTIFLMWSLRLRYFLGASADDLYRDYYSGQEN